MFQLQYQTIRPLTTAHLAQTMTMLSLTVEELRQQIEAELSSNPALELVEERRCPTCHRLLPGHGPCPVCSCPSTTSPTEPVVFVSPREDFFSSGGGSVSEDLPEDPFSASIEDLPTYVLRQIGPELAANDRKLAAFLLTHLDEDGFLTTTAIETARYLHVPISTVEKVLYLIQRTEPIGVGTRSPQEAMLIQVEVLSEITSVPAKTREVIQSSLDLLSRHQYAELARKLDIPIRQVQRIERFISENLNPYPARSSWGDMRSAAPTQLQVYHRPDILIYYQNENPNTPLVVEIILPIGGTLRVNPMFRHAVHQASEDMREAWRGDMERASLFVKCLQQRNHTMQRLMQRLVVLQIEYILKGEKYLSPVTRVKLSKELDVHESTISRAVANKSVMLPNRRIVPLSAFFDRSLNVRTVLKDIIEKEARPLSDSELTVLLSQEGFDVARRTVAKYRAMEGILPAHLRHSSQVS
jgi:RNA polymerase sigma-54 factor